jgi:hypothetical protein
MHKSGGEILRKILLKLLCLLTMTFMLNACSDVTMNEIKARLEKEGLEVKYTDDVRDFPWSATFEINETAQLKVFITSSAKEAKKIKTEDLEKAKKVYSEEEKQQYAA